MFILLAALLVAFSGFLYVLVGPGAALAGSGAVTIEDPDLDHIETDVTFNGTADATVVVTDIEGNEVDSQTVSGTSGETIVVETEVNESGDYSVEVTEGDTADGIDIESVSITDVERELVVEETVNVTDPDNETVIADVSLNSTGDARILWLDSDGSTLSTVNLSGTEGDLLTRDYSPSTEGNVTVRVTTLDLDVVEDAYVSLSDSSTNSSYIGGAVIESSSNVVLGIVAIVIVVGGVLLGREVF
jgi:hypothetical protein